MGKTSIQWTDRTWSPLRARVRDDAAAIAKQKGYASLVAIAEKMAGHVGPHCESVSHGCDNCYSGTNNHRCLPSNGTGLPFDRRSRDLVESFVDEKILMQPLRWKQPQRIFVENQSDLFGEWNTDEMIDRVFAVMALCPQHTFQVLTKRPKRILEYCRAISFERLRVWMNLAADGGEHRPGAYSLTSIAHASKKGTEFEFVRNIGPPWKNVWLGVSVEDQKTADERIPLLFKTPAAVRFVSYEPALGRVDFKHIIKGGEGTGEEFDPFITLDSLSRSPLYGPKLDWVIVGGESGPSARPFDIAWARNTIAQCKAAGVGCFVKQLGALPVIGPEENLFDWPEHVIRDVWHGGDKVKLKDRKGGDPSEWPLDLQGCRQFPEVRK